jgi:two-component system phosphate regulon sensor histidine kinase PhoR
MSDKDESIRARRLNSDVSGVRDQAKENEELIQALVNAIDSSADAMIIYDLEGNAKYVGDSFTRMFGWTKAEVIGKRIPFVPESELESSMKQIQRLIEDGKPVSGFETLRNTKDGRVLNISVSSTRYNDHEGRPAGILVIMRDITSSKLAESQLRKGKEEYRRLHQQSKRAEELYQSLINSSADAIVIYDLEGNATYVSEAFTRMFGWTKEEVVGKRIPFVPDSEREAALEGITKLIRDGVPVSGFEAKRSTKNGTVLDVSVSSSRYHDHEGNPAGILVILRDITAWKSMERARKRAVHHLAHELTTPLAVVRASTARLAQQDLSVQMKQKILERIDRNLNRLSDMQAIVQEIIEPRECKPRAFPVIQFTHQILDEIRQESAHRSVDLVPRLDPLNNSFADPIVFKKVLRTLIKNAIENTPDQGQVIVTLGKDPLGVLLKVSDQGVGIPEADRAFVFEAFHHTQHMDRYATKNPYDFDAGGKGLELMQLKILADEGCFDLWFETQRCRYLLAPESTCPERISSCEHVNDKEGCAQSGGTTFCVLFRESKN